MDKITVKNVEWFTGYRQVGRGTVDLPLIVAAIWKSRKIRKQGDHKIAWPEIVGCNLRFDRFFMHGKEVRFYDWVDMENGLDVQLQTPRADFTGYIIVRKHVEGA